MTTSELIEHFEYCKKFNNPKNYVEPGPLMLAEIETILAGLNLLRRQEQRFCADNIRDSERYHYSV